MDSFGQMNDVRQKYVKEYRSKQRQQFYMNKRLQNLLQNDVSYLIPQYIAQDKVQYLQQLHDLMVSGHHPKIGIDLSREYFMTEFDRTDNQKMKIVILKLTKWINQWMEQDYQKAFELCGHPQILQYIVEQLQSKKGKIIDKINHNLNNNNENKNKSNNNNNQLNENNTNDNNNKQNNNNKLKTLIKYIQNQQIDPKHQLIYSYLWLYYDNPEFDKTVVSLIISRIDKALSQQDNIYSAMYTLEYFLSFSSCFDLYPLIIKMKHFQVIVKQCWSSDVSSYTLAFEICIDIIHDNKETAIQLIQKYNFIKIIQKYIKNPLLQLKAMWAFSNLILYEECVQDMLPVLQYLIKKDTNQNVGKQFNHCILHQLQNIIINLLYSTTITSLDNVLPLFSLLVPYIKCIFQTPILKNVDIHKNIIYALLKFLSLDDKIKDLYLRYQIDKTLECFMIEHPHYQTQATERILDYLTSQDKEGN